MPIVLKFGVRHVLSGEEHAVSEMRDATHLFNSLVRIERWKRYQFASIRSRHVPGLAEAEAAYEQLNEWIGEHHKAKPKAVAGTRGRIRGKRKKASAPKEPGGKATPTKQVNDISEQWELAELKRWRKAAGELAKPLRAQFDAMLFAGEQEYRRRRAAASLGKDNHAKQRVNALAREAMLSEGPTSPVWSVAPGQVPLALPGVPIPCDWHPAWRETAALEATAYALTKWVGDAHSLNHGTYSAVKDDVVRAGKRPPPRPDGEPRKPRKRPAYSPNDRLRKIGWQVQGRVTWGDILDGTLLNLRVLDMRPHGSSGNRWRSTMEMRISTPVRGESEWVRFEVAVHRPIPRDTRVALIYLVPGEMSSRKRDYSLQLVVAPTEPLIQRAVGVGHADIALRWTQRGETLDVASVNGAGLLLPDGIVSTLRHAESVSGRRAELLDELKREMAKRPTDAAAPPVQSRSSSRFEAYAAKRTRGALYQAAWQAWKSHRLAAGLDLFAGLPELAQWHASANSGVEPFIVWLDCWRRKSKHLGEMADGLRGKALRRRKHFYRETAARLATQYETFALSGAVDLDSLALRDKSEDRPRELHQAARHNRQLASVHELKEAIRYAFGKDRERFGADETTGGARSRRKHAEAEAIAAADVSAGSTVSQDLSQSAAE